VTVRPASSSRLLLARRLSVRLASGLLLSAACLVGFWVLAHSVTEQNGVVNIDLALANALHEEATPTSISFYRVISAIGLPGLWVVAAVVAFLFIHRRQWLHLGVWLAALLGGILLNSLLKELFARERPVFLNPFVIEQNFSFPSGHAMMAIIGFGMLAYFAVKYFKSSYAKIFAAFGLILLIVLIGISRMTLGAHYLSDVVAGFAAGTVWLMVCIGAMNLIYRRKQAGDPAAIAERTPKSAA
jgi:undecaprenyl-diphosphatase